MISTSFLVATFSLLVHSVLFIFILSKNIYWQKFIPSCCDVLRKMYILNIVWENSVFRFSELSFVKLKSRRSKTESNMRAWGWSFLLLFSFLLYNFYGDMHTSYHQYFNVINFTCSVEHWTPQNMKKKKIHSWNHLFWTNYFVHSMHFSRFVSKYNVIRSNAARIAHSEQIMWMSGNGNLSFLWSKRFSDFRVRLFPPSRFHKRNIQKLLCTNGKSY